MARDNWGVDDVRRRCTEYREILVDAPHCCTAEELAAYWPGGEENPYPDRGGWLYCYGTYRAFLWKLKESTPKGGDDAQRYAVERALAGEPERVQLDQTDEAGIRYTRNVFPKSFHALLHAMDRDLVLQQLTEDYRRIESVATLPARALLGNILTEIGYQHRVLAWLVCHDGPGCPWPETESRPTPPAWTETLSAFDLFRLMQAHRRVNGSQLQIVSTLLATGNEGDGDSSPASWSTLVAVAAKQSGQSSRALMRDEPLVALVAQMLVTHAEETKQHAAAAAKQKKASVVVPAMEF